MSHDSLYVMHYYLINFVHSKTNNRKSLTLSFNNNPHIINWIWHLERWIKLFKSLASKSECYWGINFHLNFLSRPNFTSSGNVLHVNKPIIAGSSIPGFKLIDWLFQTIELNIFRIIFLFCQSVLEQSRKIFKHFIIVMVWFYFLNELK